MSFNLLDAAKNFLPNDLISQAASSLGESESGVQKAVGSAIPAIFSGLLNQSSGNSGSVLNLLKNVGSNSDLLSNLTGLFNGGGGSGSGSGGISATILGWLKSLFGDKLDSIISSIAGFSGIKTSSASSVLSMAAPAVLAPLAKHVSEKNLSASSLTSLLNDQKSSLLNAVPSGFNLAGAFGLSSLGDLGSSLINRVSDTAGDVKDFAEGAIKKTKCTSWLLPLLLLIGIGILVWFLTQKGCKNKTATDAHKQETTSTGEAAISTSTIAGMLDSTTGNFIYDLGAEKEIKLADGTLLKVGENSTEAKIFQFLNDATTHVDTTDKSKGWITLDRVYFETGKSVLTAASQVQLQNLAMILKAFPNAKIKLGGYTDNTGSEEVNIRISGTRANRALGEMAKLGTADNRLVAEGYGSQHPVCAANDTDACKAQNRRVDIRITAK